MAKLLHKNEFSFGDLLGFNVGLLDDNAVNEAIGLVNEKYAEKGASGVIAKSSTFINDIDEAIKVNSEYRSDDFFNEIMIQREKKVLGC